MSTTTWNVRGRGVTLDEEQVGKVTRMLNRETGELDFAEEMPTWDDFAEAFAHREETAIALGEWKEEGKRIKLEDEEAQAALIRLGRQLRQARAAGRLE